MMTQCGYCGATILFGGKKMGEWRFCNANCMKRGALVAASIGIPDELVRQRATAVHQGPCPKCHEASPVDVHVNHRVWSLVFLTSWRSQPQISCRRCGMRAQLGATAFSLICGWWGIPWGLFMTPIVVYRNLSAVARNTETAGPSPQLEQLIRLEMAKELEATRVTATAA